MAVKISVLGAGSSVFSMNFIKDLCLTESLAGSEISFMDISEERLDNSYGLCCRLAAEMGVDFRITKTTSREESLKGASFVVDTILIGGYDNWTDPTDLRYQEDATVRTKFLCFDQKHSMFDKYVTREMIDPTPECISKFFPMFQKIIPLDDWTYRDTDFFHMNYSSDAYAIRSAETYLLLAEAYLRSGEVEKAVKAVNTLRERAQCTTMYTTDGFDIDDILDERARELIYEEARWFTFLRMEPEVWKQRIYDHAMYWSDYKKVTTPIAWNLWPIPQDIIDLNTGAPMEQNAGWK